MKITNPGDREIIATIDGATVEDRKTYTIPAGESIDVDDYVVASTLIEHGAVGNPAEVQVARQKWAERNRGINSRTASASQSEGAILGNRQATVDVATGSSDPGTGGAMLTGNELAKAVREAKAAGATIDATSAAGKRDQLAVWQAQQGSSTPVSDEFLVDEDGDLVLDGEGQPYALADVYRDNDEGVLLDENDQPYVLSALARDEQGDVVLDDDGRPVLATVEDTGTGQSGEDQGVGGSSG